jgi:hypothetical protein
MGSAGVERLRDELVRDLAPVRRVRSPAIRTVAWLGLEALVLGWVLLVEPRPDLGAAVTMPGFALELLGFVVASAGLAMLAFRSGVPGERPGRLVRALAVVAFVLAAAHVATLPLRTDGSVGELLAGRGCAARMALLAIVPWLVMLAALRRAAPFHGATSGALAAGAACLMAFAFMRVSCPSDDVLHVAVWHGLPILAALVVSVGVGALWLPRWRR